MIRERQITYRDYRKMTAFVKSIVVLFLVILLFQQEGLFAQVISNTGAAISVAGAVVGSKDLENSSGTLGNNGTINLSGNYFNQGTTNGNGFYNLRGQWTNNGSFIPGTSTVTLYGTVNQTINNNSSGETFYNLIINNPGSVITQIANAGNTLGVLRDLTITSGTLSLHTTTSALSVGGKATINGSLIFNNITTETTTIGDILSGPGTIDMSGGNLPHLMNLAGATNAIGTFTTSPIGASTVNYNGTGPTQTVFAVPNYRNLIISNSGIKTLQGNSVVGINLTISGGTFDLGTTATTLNVLGITNITGALSFSGISTKTVSLTGNLSGSGGIDMSGGDLPHLLNLDGSTNSLGTFTTSTLGSSTVDYRNGNQIVFISDKYRNVITSGGGVKTLNADISASGVLTMTSGDINSNGNTLKITNSVPGAIIRTSGTVIGKLQRAIGVTGSEYLYPLGTSAVYNPLKLTFQNLTSGPLTAQFKPEDIGSAGLPLDDDGNEIFDRYTTGYWSLTSVAPMATGSFTVNLNYTGFLGIDLSSSVIKRTNSGNLELDGVHGAVTGSEITRTVLVNGISTTTTDLAIGKGRPRISDNGQPHNIDICEGSNAFFEVIARGRGTLTYQWQVSTNGTTYTNLVDGGVYSGTLTKKLIITGAPYSMNGYLYRVIVTDGQGHPNTSNPALLTVNKIPIAIATPSTQVECPGVPFQTIVLGTTNSVTGTTFAYSYIKPSGINTQLPTSGLAVGDVINGTFTNTTDTPITVTFTIIPTGPGTTFCVGLPITATVAVNPTPRVFTVPVSSIQCDSTITNIKLSSPSTFTSGSISFKYTVTVTPAGTVTGFTSPITGLPNNSYITDKLFNQTDNYQTVTYRVVPVSPVGCIDGPSQSATVTVNPTPRVIPLNSIKPAICYGGTSEITLTTPSVMTSGAIKFDYTISFTGVPGDVVGNATPGNNLVPGQKLMFSYTNSAPPNRIDTVNSVLFAIRPKVVNMDAGLVCNAGRIVIPSVKVHPKTIKYNYPATNGIGILITKPLTCINPEGSSSLGALRVILTKGADPYTISWTGPVKYTNDSVDIVNLNVGKYTVKVVDSLGCRNDTSITVAAFTARPQINVTVILPNIHVSCPGGSDGEITAFVQAGITAPYYFWIKRYNPGNPDNPDILFNGLFTGNFNPADTNTYKTYKNLKAGIYYLVITDVNNCEVIKTSELKEPAPVTVPFAASDKSNYNGYNISCHGYSNGWVLARPSGGNGSYSYQWYAASGIPLTVSTNTSLLDSVPAGKYYLVTKDLLDCTKTDSVTLTEPDGMQLVGSELSFNPDGNKNISCSGGNDGFIKLTISGGSGVYNYSWTGPNSFTANTRDIFNLKAGTYIADVADNNGCYLKIMPGSISPTYTLYEPSVLTIASTASISNDGGYNINCDGGKTGWINTTVSGGGIGTYTYNWSTTDGSGIIDGQKDQTGLTAGTYHLKITDSNNCTTEKDITLTQPATFGTQIKGSDITCQSPGFNNGSINLTVFGGVVPYTYLWSNGAVTEDISGLTQGLYNVTITYNTSCQIKDSIRINLPPALNYTKTLSDYNGYNISCNGLANGSIQVNPLSGLAPFVYTWTSTNGFTGTTQDISELKAGQYKLTIVDNNFCSATETINLTEPGKLGMNFNLSESIAGGFNINCVGDNTGSIEVEPLNQVKTVDYLWSDGIFGQTRKNLPAGDYNIIITDANDCYANSTVTLTQPDTMKLIFDISKPFCPDKPDGEIRLKVSGGVVATDYSYKWSDNSTGSTISNIPGGYYKVTVNDLNGCSIKDSVIIEPLNETCLIIPNAISPNGDLINDVWNIGMKELYPAMVVKIFNRWGEPIWKSEKGYPQPWDGRSNGSLLPIDSYHYIIDLHNGTKPLVGNITIVR